MSIDRGGHQDNSKSHVCFFSSFTSASYVEPSEALDPDSGPELPPSLACIQKDDCETHRTMHLSPCTGCQTWNIHYYMLHDPDLA